MARTPLYMSGLPTRTRKLRHRHRLMVLGGVATLVVAGAVLGNGLSLAGKAQEGVLNAGSTASEARFGVLTAVHELPVVGRAFALPPVDAAVSVPDTPANSGVESPTAAMGQTPGFTRRVFAPIDPEARIARIPAAQADAVQPVSPVDVNAAGEAADDPGNAEAAAQPVQNPQEPAFALPTAALPSAATIAAVSAPVATAADDPQPSRGRDDSRGNGRDSAPAQAVTQLAPDPNSHLGPRHDAQTPPQSEDGGNGGDNEQGNPQTGMPVPQQQTFAVFPSGGTVMQPGTSGQNSQSPMGQGSASPSFGQGEAGMGNAAQGAQGQHGEQGGGHGNGGHGGGGH